MNYTIKELEKKFADFDSSDLIAQLVKEGYTRELSDGSEEEILVAVDELTAEETIDWYDSSGYTWREQLQETQTTRNRVFSVADIYHTWYMGLVQKKV